MPRTFRSTPISTCLFVMKCVYAWCFLVVITAVRGLAQDADQFQLNLYGNITIPSAEFKEAADNSIGGIGVGVGGNVLINPMGKRRHSFVFPGIDFSYLTFGRDKIASTKNSPPYKTTFNYYSVSGQIRVFLTGDREGIAPFIDGMVGLKVINTRTKIDKNALDYVFGDDQPEVIHSQNDAGLGNGAGLGVYWRRYNVSESGERHKKVSFTLRAMYLWGDPTEYVKRGTVEVENGHVTFEEGTTMTNMVLIQLGVCLF